MLPQEKRTKKVHLRGIDEKLGFTNNWQPETDGSVSPASGLVRGRTNLNPAIPSPRKNLQVLRLKREEPIQIWHPVQNKIIVCRRNIRKIAYSFKPWGVKSILATSPFASISCSPLCSFELKV